MKRNFPNFIEAYVEYSRDNFCPEQFHLWTGLSILAGALERKVWVKQYTPHSSVVYYPNIYVFLVSHPSVGKTTAMDRGVELLERLKHEENPEFKLVSNQGTEPGLIEAMKVRQAVQIGSVVTFQSTGYFYASEASASALQNTCGDFVATLTAFYDCPRWFTKTLKSGTTEIPNVCFNMLAGATFNYLQTLVNEKSALGGFASRCVYVVSKDRVVTEAKWLDEAPEIPMASRMVTKLVEDLRVIHRLVGAFKPTRGFIERWEKWQPEFKRKLIKLGDERLEAINARKGTNLMKVCMLMSVAENNDLILSESHWDRALEVMDAATGDNSFILNSAIMAKIDTQAGLNQLILHTIKENGGSVSLSEIKRVISVKGNDVTKVNPTLELLKDSGQIGLHTINGAPHYKLLVNPDANFQ